MAMFAAAFIAMRSVRLLPVFSSPAEEISAPTIIRRSLAWSRALVAVNFSCRAGASPISMSAARV